jgi:hypothetical protein
MIRRSSRLISVLLLGLVIALVIGALTKRDSPVLIWLIVIGVGLMVGIGQEWITTNKLPLAHKKSLLRDYSVFALGSFPYVAALTLLVVFVYYAAKLLLGHTVDSSQSRTLGRVVVLSFAAVFLGGFVLCVLAAKRRAVRKSDLNHDGRQP